MICIVIDSYSDDVFVSLRYATILPMKHTARERTDWILWHRAHGENVAATCRQFGIARSTFYRWVSRYDVVHPRRSLSNRSRAPHRRQPSHLQPLFLIRVIELNTEHPRWSGDRLQRELRALRDDAPSTATISRWLRVIRERCPLCQGKDGRHNEMMHALRRDLQHYGPRIRLAKAQRGLSKSGAVSSVERMIARGRQT
jgi:transposase-like protein